MDENCGIRELIVRANDGEEEALNQLFELYHTRLKKMVNVRLNSRIRGRVDESDVLQDAYLEASKRLREYLQDPRAPFFLWLRQITNQKIIDIHRRHLGVQVRDAGREVSLGSDVRGEATSLFLAEHFLGGFSSPSQIMIKRETKLALENALNAMDEADREILSLRHYEELSNQEVATELGLEVSAASKRYFRALKRLQVVLVQLGLGPEISAEDQADKRTDDGADS